VVGCLVAYLAARLPGAAVQLIDIDPARADIAARLDVPFAPPDRARDGCDLVVHASASADGLATALALAGTEATVVEASWYGDRPVPAPLGAGFHPKRLRLLSSQVGMVAPSQRPRWDHGRRLDLALTLLQDTRLEALVQGRHPFVRLPTLMAELAGKGGLCHTLQYCTETAR